MQSRYKAYKALVTADPYIHSMSPWMDLRTALVYDIVLGNGQLTQAIPDLPVLINDPFTIREFMDLAGDILEELTPIIGKFLSYNPDKNLLSELYQWISTSGTEEDDALDALNLVHTYGVPYPPNFMTWLLESIDDMTNCELIYDYITDAYDDWWGLDQDEETGGIEVC